MESLKSMPFWGQCGHWKVPYFGLRNPWNKIILWFKGSKGREFLKKFVTSLFPIFKSFS
jgi:hypothetical protein